MKRVLAIGVLLLALTGCGTVENFNRGGISEATPYGGVEVAVVPFKPGLKNCGFPPVVGLPFYTGDVVLSAIGDTVTLPVFAWRAGRQWWDLAFHYDEPLPQQNEWRQFWYNDPPLLPERIQGGIY